MRNIVLLCLDTVREDHFEEFAPRLRERADLEFRQCRAASSWSVPSHASMFTGKLAHEHGIHTHNRDFSGLSRKDTFLGDLPDHRALGASANVWASSSFGLDGLFDEFSDVSPDRRFPEGIDVARFGQNSDRTGIHRQLAFIRAALAHNHPLKSMGNGVLVQLDDWFARLPIANPFDDGASIIAREARSQVADTDEPFALFANFMDAHGPLTHVRGYDRSLHNAPLSWTSEGVDWGEAVEHNDQAKLDRYTGLYGAAIDYLDRQVCDLADWLHANTDRETTIVVTSDHGDEMGTGVDEGRWGHTTSSLSEGLLHVPFLVLNAPDGHEHIDESRYVSHLALREFLVGLTRDEVTDPTADRIPAERVGHSGSLATIDDKRGTTADRLLRAVYDDQYKYQWGSQESRAVYRLDTGRPNWQERTDGEFDPAEFAEFFRDPAAGYKHRAASGQVAPDIGDVTRDRLENLGYI
jgi:arylsulfatase A-like enzyme